MRNYIALMIGFIVLISISGCSGSSEGRKIDYEKIAEGIYAPIPEKAYFVINNEQDYLEFFNKTGMVLKERDFEKYTYIAIFMGEKPTGGYIITVREIVLEGGKAKVHVEFNEPSETCFVTQQITRPFLVIRTEKINEQIEFVEGVKKINC